MYQIAFTSNICGTNSLKINVSVSEHCISMGNLWIINKKVQEIVNMRNVVKIILFNSYFNFSIASQCFTGTINP